MPRKDLKHMNLDLMLKPSEDALKVPAYAASFPPYLPGNTSIMYVMEGIISLPKDMSLIDTDHLGLNDYPVHIQLACLLKSGVDFVKKELEKGIKKSVVFSSLVFKWNFTEASIPTNVAAIKIGRLLWTKIIKEYEPVDSEAMKFRVFVKPQNELQLMIALMGSVDYLDLTEDLKFYKENECLITKVVDPLNGNKEMDECIIDLSKDTWSVFKKIESYKKLKDVLDSGILDNL